MQENITRNKLPNFSQLLLTSKGFEINNLEKTIIKYYLEEIFKIGIQINIINLNLGFYMYN
jgi:hypothetical protein